MIFRDNLTLNSRKTNSRKTLAPLVAIISVFVLSSCASLVRPNYTTNITELRSGEYSLDPEHAYINFSVEHLGLSRIIGRFNQSSGSLDFDANKLEDLSLQGIIEAASIDVNNEDLEDTLREPGWFNVAAHPQILFESNAVKPLEDGNLIISGQLTINGIEKPIELLTRFNGGADNILTGKYTVGFVATTKISRSNFGMDSFAALVGDEIEIELHGEFQKN